MASPSSTETPQPPRETLLLVSACCVLLLVLQFTTVTKLWVILTSYRGPIGEYVSRLRDIEWTLLDLTLVGLFGLCATALLVLEVVACRWTVFLTWVTDRDARVQVIANEVYVDRVRLSVSTNRPCFARLAYGYYPDLRVRVDGVPVETRMTAAGFAVIELPGGDHTIDISGNLSLLRKSLLIFDALLLAGLLAWGRRNSRTYPTKEPSRTSTKEP